MFPTNKSDVDRHVEECLRKINNETERNIRCLSFAKQYFKIERFEEARRYVSSYLSVKPNSAEAHCLLGKCLENLGRKEAAIQAYTASIRLDPKQNNLVLKVCELLASDDVELDQSGAKYFCEIAQTFDPHHPALFNLKQRLLTSENDDPRDVSNLILKELESRPTDVKLRIRLLRHLMQNHMVKEAYKHASDIESKNLSVFHNNLPWYEAVAEVLVKYQRSISLPDSLGWEFWFLSVSVLDQLVSLSLEEYNEHIKCTTEYVNTLFNFDQTLTKAFLNVNDCPDKQLLQEFINHYSAQLCFHFATLVFKQAKKDLIKFKEAANVTLPLLFAAYHAQPPDIQSMWFNHASENSRNLVRKWRCQATFRCSQTGHILQSAAKDKKSIILEKANQYSTGMWRDQLFKKVFITRDQQLKMKTSYFLNDQKLLELTIRLPDNIELLKYDEEAQLNYPDSLHHHIWIALNNKLSEVKCTVFEGLQYSIKHLKNCGAETLNVLDMQAFIYCATLCAKLNLENSRHISYSTIDKPLVPVAITQELGTLNQKAFFRAAYRMYKNEYDSAIDQLRLTLIDGIKIVRSVDGGLDVKLLAILAKTFAERATKATKQSEVEANEARAELYWRSALPILEKMRNNQAVTYPPNKLFTYRSKDLSLSQVCALIEAGKLFTGCQCMKKKEYENALHIFETLKDPYASFHQAQIYKLMADQLMSQNKESVTSEMRSQNIILLSRSRDCLYLTLDRLREPSVDQKHPLNEQLGSEIEKIEILLSRIDPDCTNRNECDGMSDENVSSADSTGDHYVTGFSVHNSNYYNGTLNNHSTPYRSDLFRREAKPSPERLDAQLRQLAVSKDAAINHILEHNKIMVDSHRNLVDELRSFKEAVNHLTSTVEELKNMKHSYEDLKDIKKSVTELKASIDDLDNFKNISDMVYEMKKELADLKKDINKPNQLSDEDIYGLASEYGAEYNLNSNLSAYNPGLYQNFQARIPGAPLYGPGALYTGMYPAVPYGYPGLGLPQPHNNLQFSADQIPSISTQDMRTISAALAQVQPTTTYSQPPLLPNLPQTTTFNRTVTSSVPTTKAPPVNVVITTSDPLPSTKVTTSQPILSVTIPPQHLKGNVNPKVQPHNYQIPLPTTNAVSTSPSVLSKPPPAVSTQSILSNVAPPVYSAVSDKTPTSVNLGLQIEKSLETSFSSVKNESLNKSNVSSTSVEEHDPCPDFKPIIPLPDEVPLNTGEENETVLFCERAKLFRYMSETKEWKERGIGTLKILKSNASNKIRILMRRDQVLKICANHFLNKDMVLTPMAKCDAAYIWAAHDFADEKVVLEKLCAKFKTVEEAKRFYTAFENAKALLENDSVSVTISTPVSNTKKTIDEPKKSESANLNLGGFVFSGTPSFKPKLEQVSTVVVTTTASETKTSPFAAFAFTPTSKIAASNFQCKFSPVQTSVASEPIAQKDKAVDEESDDFVPTAEFKPVVPLPELVEVKTGEENSDVVFESRGKLLRFDVSGEKKEWKEKGVGVMKVIKDNMVRLVMRRDQVLKVCCNHQLLKNMDFKVMNNNPKTVIWCAKDYSEGVVKPETFAFKLKTDELADSFLKTIKSLQQSMDENSCLTDETKVETPKTIGFGDKFKPVKGSWECKNCLVINDSKTNYCVACDTPKNDAIPPKKNDDASGAAFSFGVANMSAVTNSWGNAFKPKEGSWECKSCYTRNEADKSHCVSCEAPKDDTVKKENKGVNLDTGGLKFSFGVPVKEAQKSFGDAFKPKQGSWECKQCLIRNDADILCCVACANPKDGTAPKDSTKKADLDMGSHKFSFGIPSTAEQTPKAAFTFGQSTVTPQNKAPESSFVFKPTVGFTETEKKDSPTGKFVFGSPQKHDFEFTPRSPRRISSGGKDEESDASYVEEECDNIYFKPVIPLPDKVEVKTGEEQEEALYCHRAKLYRFVGGEWKERGLGDLKILKRKDTGKLRVLMRREQVFKICLNHILTPDIKYVAKDDKSWLFGAADFSEGELVNEQFCLRFKNAEIAQEFMKAVNDAVNGASSSVTVKEEKSDDEVEFISETKVTPEEEKEAIKLGLPPKFFSYRQLPDCQCDQCKKDDLYLKDLLVSSKSSTSSMDSPLSLSGSSSATSFNTPREDGFSFKTASETSLESNVTLKGLLSKPSILATPKTDSVFTPPAVVSTPTTTEVSSSPATIFGSKPDIFKTPDQSKSFSFGQSSNVFGTPTTVATGNIFGSGSNIFGASTASNAFGAPKTTNLIFGSATTPTTTSIFGAATNTSLFKTSNIFSATPTTPSSIFNSSIFGGTPVTSTTTTGIFGGTTPSTTSIFGGTPTVTTASIFGGTSTPSTTASIFSGTPITTVSIFGGTPASNTTASSIFGGSPAILGSKNEEAKSVFGGGDAKSVSSPLFGGVTKTEAATISLKESDAPVLDSDSGVTFAALAAKTSTEAAPAFAKKDDNSTTPFAFLGAGAPVFGSRGNPSKDSATDELHEGGGDEEYDPHYDPIVPLPDAIVVSTGEEDEQVLFNERAKLYRFDADNKEWKERGIGQMKILHHPVNNTYRFLLRREQIHKVVLNQLIIPDLELQPMKTSDKAWVWAGYNYTDDDSALEKLAVKFKYSDLAQSFYKIVGEVVEKVKKAQSERSIQVEEISSEAADNLVPSTIQNFGVEDVSGDEQTQEAYDEGEDEEDDEDDEDDDDDRTIMFMKPCTLHEEINGEWKVITAGELQVYYDPDLYAARICVNDEGGSIVSNTLIGINTVMQIDKSSFSCIWKAVEWATGNYRYRTLKATFSNAAAAEEFQSNYLEGLNYAQEFDVVDQIPGTVEEETE